ncbi:MAG TPA: translocation/assembly module TamB domain-containing protein, partial [bacterium]|nr:translocation/assembly module TamB domain-containing protein [bacterium]
EATRALGREVHIDALGGDPWRGIVLRGVRIAGPAGSPRAFFEAPRVVLTFDAGQLVRDLIAGRGVVRSLTRVELERPFLVLARDGSGRWNYADLLGSQRGAGPTPPSFRAAVDVREGTLIFSDALRLPQRAGPRPPSPFAAHFDRISGSLDFGTAPLLGIVLDAVNTDGLTPALLRVSGRATLGEATFDLDLDARGGSVAVWGPYLVRLPWVVWGGGTFDSTMHLLVSRWGGRIVLDYRGQLTMRDGRALLLPRRTLLSDIDGPLTVDNLGVTTTGLTMAVDASPVSARGRITYQGGAAMDLALRSRAIDLRTLQKLLFPRAQVRLSGRARGEVRITGSFGSPSVEGKIDRASGSIDRQGFADLSGRFQYYGGLLSFDDLAASAGGGRLRGHLRLDVGAGTFFVLADAHNVDAHILDGVGLTVTPTFSGAATGFVAAARTPDGLLAQGRLSLGRGTAFGVGFDRAESVFGYDRGLLEVDHFEARSGATRLHGFGAMSRSGALDFAVVGTDVNLGTVGERFGLQRWIAGRADVNGRLLGTLRSPELEGRIRGRDGRLGPLPFELARGRVRVTSTTLRTPGLLLYDADGRYFATGLIRWAEPSRVDLTVRAANVAAQRLLEIAEVPLRVGGTIETTVRLAGPINRPTAQGVVELRDGHVEGQPVDRATAAFRWTGTHLLVQSFSAAVNGSTLLASGSISRTGALGISFSAQALDVKDIAALKRDALRLAGTVDLTGSIRGTLGAPAISAAATSGNLVVNGQQFDRARGQVSYRGGRLALTPLVLQQTTGTFQLSGTVLLRDDPVVDLHVSATQGELTTLLGLARVRSPIALRGTLDGEVTAAGPVSNPRASVNIRLADGRVGDEPIQEAVVRAELANQAVNLEILRVVPAQGELVGAGRINLRGRSEVEFGGTGVDLNLLRPLFNLQRPLRGVMDFTLQLTGELNDPLIGLSAAAAEGGIGPMSFDRLTLQAFYRAGQFHIEHGVIQEDRHRLQVTGSLPFNPARMRLDEARPVNLRLELVDSDLSILSLFSEAIERAEGGLAGAVSITGTAARPHLEGQVTASGGTLKVRGLDPALTDLQARITFAEDTLRVDNLRARAGDGTLGLTGSVGFRRFRPDQLNLTLAADGARLSLPGLFSGRVDGGVRVTGTLVRPEVSGTATLSNGDIVVSAAQRLAARPTNGTSGPRLDLEVRAGDALWVNVGGLRFQVGGTVRTSGTLTAPRLSGEVVAERGAFVAFNTTFRLLEGRATFSEFRGMTPFVDAIAETRVTIPRKMPDGRTEFERTVVRLHVTGTPDALELQVSSDPSFPRNELIAALGRQSGFAALFTGGADLETALLNELSNALFGQVGRAVASALGLEEFTLEYDSERQLTLRIGRLLIENLYLTWTSEFGTPRRTVWALEYRLSPTTRVSFSVDNFARYNFLYRVTYAF